MRNKNEDREIKQREYRENELIICIKQNFKRERSEKGVHRNWHICSSIEMTWQMIERDF